MTDKDKDVLVSVLLFFLGIYVTIASITMPSRGTYMESPGLMPSMLGVCLIILAVLYYKRSASQGGKLKLGKIGTLFTSLYTSDENRKTMLAIIFVALYIFVGVPYIGYYISSGIFMVGMFLMYVKRFKTWVSVCLACGLALTLFLTFDTLFQLTIK